MEFVWDAEKAVLNYSKHRVTFEEAQSVFEDTCAYTFLTLTILRMKTDLSFWV